MSRQEILDLLCGLLPAAFEDAVFRLGVPVEHLSPGTVARSTRAIEVIRYLESIGRLPEIVPLLPVRPSPRPTPAYPDERTRGLSERLAGAYQRKKETLIVGQDTAAIEAEILDLRRQLRHGPQLRAGEFLDGERYQLIEVIGDGGFAVVWRAYDEQEQILVAIKVLHGQWAQDRTRRERFFRGARQMARLHHPGIVRVLVDHGEEDGHHYFVMEHLAGGDFRKAVLSGYVPRGHAHTVIQQIGAALQHAHEQGIVHRDVKPANILLAPDGSARLTEFDLVRARDTTGGTRTSAMGTFLYAAPEEMENAQGAGPRADVYGLGMCTVFALYGRDLPARLLRAPEAFVQQLRCPPALQQVVLKAVEWDAEQRFASVAEFCAALVVVSAHDDLPEMVRIPTGAFWMGSPEGEVWRGSDETRHRVTISSFLLARTPVTQGQYAAVMESDPSCFKGRPDLPVEQVSWLEAVLYCNRLSEKEGLRPCYEIRGEMVTWSEGLSATGYRLPTEAEWEHAARATNKTRYAGSDDLDEVAWYERNSGGTTQPVAKKKKNGWGLYDMSGNVWEWVWDWYGPYPGGTVKDPIGPEDGSDRVFRGGSFRAAPLFLRVAYRYWGGPGFCHRNLGFRVARSFPSAL